MIGVGVVGYGYWGPNLARNLAEHDKLRLVAISDLRRDRLEAAGARHRTARLTADQDELICAKDVDAIAIATPVSTHHAVALAALRQGKHVLVSKPLAASSAEARELAEEAERRGLVLLVDHTFVYSGAVRKIRELIAGGELGDVLYYDSVRVNLGLFQHDVNVVWDLATHDLAILDYVLGMRPRAVAAFGADHFSAGHANMAYLTLQFEGSAIAHMHVNWLSPVKVRRTLIGGSRRMVVYDDLEPDEKVKVYDRGVGTQDDPAARYRMLVGYRVGDMWAPQLSRREPLQQEVDHFVACIEGRSSPETGGESGRRLVAILEAANESLAHRGAFIELPAEL